MRYAWIDEYLMRKPGAVKEKKECWNWITYQVGGKIFAAILLDPENKPYYINLKLPPEEDEMLRRQYREILPGYYSNKKHWNSVQPDGDVPDALMRRMLDTSYELVFSGLSKKMRTEIGDSGKGEAVTDAKNG